MAKKGKAKLRSVKHIVCRECTNGHCEVFFIKAMPVPSEKRPLTNCWKAKWKEADSIG
jgi:hypothetical protein